MKKDIRILLIEDSEDDACLLLHQFNQAGYTPHCKRIDNASDLKTALENESWDVIISDYSLPSFTGHNALEILKETNLDLPFILVSGNIEDNIAISAMKSGAHDFLEKNNLSRLIPVIEREIAEAEIRKKEKETTQKLRKSEERLRVALRSIADSIITTDVNGNIELINKTAEHITGWNYKDAIKKPLTEVFNIINDYTSERYPDPIIEILEQNEIIEFHNHTVLIDKNNNHKYITGNAAPIKDNSNNIIGAVIVFRDETESRKIERELQKASQLESIGILAGGIAHDFNNFLTPIIGTISLLKEEDNVDTKLLEIIETAANEARNLTKQLLTFSKGGAPVKKISTIENLIKNTINFALSGSNIKSNLNIPKNIWATNIDEGQITQVMNNIIINAKQAMPEGGEINITVDNIKITQEKRILTFPHKVGKFVKISIRDHGKGIPINDINRIFDPFFSTKKDGNGLGLAITFSIIKKHEGYITVESEPNKGTTFHLYLPALKEDSPSKMKPQNKTISGKGKILLMDDDKNILVVTGAMLENLGYDVILTENGENAIEEILNARELNSPIDLAIMDLTIPGGMGGKEAIEKIKVIDPDFKIIVSSGYSNDEIMANHKAFGVNGILVKPYQITDLSSVLNKVLESS